MLACSYNFRLWFIRLFCETIGYAPELLLVLTAPQRVNIELWVFLLDDELHMPHHIFELFGQRKHTCISQSGRYSLLVDANWLLGLVV